MADYQRIYRIARRVPEGRVTTYGWIARAAGCGARQVGYAMAAVKPNDRVPWHRVVNREGRISPRGGGEGESRQRGRLEAEGVVFDASGRIDLDRFGWSPDPDLEELPLV